jgi:hypothetical protein
MDGFDGVAVESMHLSFKLEGRESWANTQQSECDLTKRQL